MTTKIKLTVAEVVLVVVLALGMLTAVQFHTNSTADSFYQEIAGDTCSSDCTSG